MTGADSVARWLLELKVNLNKFYSFFLFPFLKKNIKYWLICWILCPWVFCLHLCLCALCMQCSWGQKQALGPWVGVTDGFQLPFGCCKANSGPLQEQMLSRLPSFLLFFLICHFHYFCCKLSRKENVCFILWKFPWKTVHRVKTKMENLGVFASSIHSFLIFSFLIIKKDFWKII